MDPLTPNTIIQDRYLVVHLIGKGGMGEVYLAVDQRLGSAVALKRTNFSGDATLLAAFEREARTLARLRHPVLPKVSDHFSDDGHQYLVMEHIAGDDIAQRLELSGKAFPLGWVMFWADQLLDALAYLHSHTPPIIHRDIKPQNLKLTDENRIVLLDFGLSKTMAGASRDAKNSVSLVGYTPHFAPMEQIRGTGTDARSDIYALSATLYQLMTDHKPDDSLSRADAVLTGNPDPVVPPSEINNEIAPGVSDVIMRGLEITQEKRYGSAAEMQKALRSAYTQMKEAMTAKTVVISDPSVISVAEPLPEQAVPAAPIIDAAPLYDPASANDAAYEATIQMNAVVEDAAPKQSDLKTEVFLAGSLVNEQPAPAAEITEEASSPFEQEPYVEPQRPEPAATVPLIDLGTADVPPATAAAAPPPLTVTAGSIDMAGAAVEADPTPAPAFVPPPPAQPQKPRAAAAGKRSGSKAGIILGGLAAFFLLILAAGALGWYFFIRTDGSGDIKSSSVPDTSVTPDRSPSPSPAGSNTDLNTNTDTTVSPTPALSPTPFGETRPTPPAGTTPAGPASADPRPNQGRPQKPPGGRAPGGPPSPKKTPDFAQ